MTMVSAYPEPSTSKPSLFSDFLTEIESEELNIPPSNLSENTSDDDDNEFYSILIAEVNERNPLWDHRHYEPIKQNLWNEIYVALNG